MKLYRTNVSLPTLNVTTVLQRLNAIWFNIHHIEKVNSNDKIVMLMLNAVSINENKTKQII